jgi:hypothetical protein
MPRFAAIVPMAVLFPLVTQLGMAQKTPGPDQPASVCNGSPACVEVTSFVATVTDFRESVDRDYRVVSVTVRFRNTTAGLLVLGYVRGSGLVTDDQGNRYNLGDGRLRGLGEIAPGFIDPKFALQPGEASDARLEFVWRPGGQVLGTRFIVELAVREIEALPGNQWRLAREHALQFRGFGDPPVAAASAAVAGTPVAKPGAGSEAVTAPPAPAADACAGRPRCYSAGPFLAEITRLNTSQATRFQDIRVAVRFRNLSSQPLALAQSFGTTLIVDDQGNRYTPNWTGLVEVQGMGQSRGGQADPSFVLRPGESREASFTVRCAPGTARLGTVYAFDFAVEELELLPRNQVRSVRQYAVGFRDVTVVALGLRGVLRSLIDIRTGPQRP